MSSTSSSSSALQQALSQQQHDSLQPPTASSSSATPQPTTTRSISSPYTERDIRDITNALQPPPTEQNLSSSFSSLNINTAGPPMSSSSAAIRIPTPTSTDRLKGGINSDAVLSDQLLSEEKQQTLDDLALLPTSSSNRPSMDDEHGDDAYAAYAALNDLNSITGRHITRRALNASLDRASRLKSSSSLARFSVNTVDKLLPTVAKNMAVKNWRTYGDPLVTYLDTNIDKAVDLIDSTGLLPQSMAITMSPSQVPIYTSNHTVPPHSISDSRLRSSTAENRLMYKTDSSSSVSSDLSPRDEHKHSERHDHRGTALTSSAELERHQQLMAYDQSARALYTQYWERLKEKFVQSKWYGKVDEILLQNSVVRAFSNRLGHWQRPAEVFYNTVTEEFMSHGAYDDFLQALTQKLGPAWDDRLAPLAKGFFTTAKAVSALVGAGKFVGGALQLGRAKVHSAIDDLLARWDRVLGLTDDMIDRYLPERPSDYHHHHGRHSLHSPPLLLAAESASHEQKRKRENASKEKHKKHRHRSRSAERQRELMERDRDQSGTSTSTSASTDFSDGSDDISVSDDSSISDSDFSSSSTSDSSHDDVFEMDLEPADSAPSRTVTSSSPTTALDTDSAMNGVVPTLKSRRRKRGNDHLYSESSEDDVKHDGRDDDRDTRPAAPYLADGDNHTYRSVPGIAQKLNKRLRQRIPSMGSRYSTYADHPNGTPPGDAAAAGTYPYVEELKRKLQESGWFNAVDDLLMQNMFVKALANFIQPAEHFFNTSLHLFQRRVTVPMQMNSPHLQHHTAPTTSQQLSLPPSFTTPPNLNGTNISPMPNGNSSDGEPASEATTMNGIAEAASTTSASDGTPSPTQATGADGSAAATNKPSYSHSDPVSTSSTSSSAAGSISTRPAFAASEPTSASPLPEGLVDDFVLHLRDAMGASWDERLIQPAHNFLATALELRLSLSAAAAQTAQTQHNAAQSQDPDRLQSPPPVKVA